MQKLSSYRKIITHFFSITSFAIFIAGLYFLADTGLFLAIGFGILLLIHELGHVLALKRLGMATRGVYFLPFVGAFVPAKEQFTTDNDYAYFKYLGLLTGTLGVLIALLLFFFFKDQRLLYLVFAGAILNLVNLTPITFLDGHGMLRGVIKRAEWIGFLIAIIAGFFVFQEYMLTLLFLVIFILFSDSPTEEATGYQHHEVILASAFILAMIFLTIKQGEPFVWNISYIVLSIYLFGAYIKATCFNNKQEQTSSKKLPLTKKQRLLWGSRWLSLATILLVTAFYADYLLK